MGEFRAHAAEWTANVSAEFKETRRRLSVDIYDKFQRAASIKRKLSAELGLNNAPIGQEMTPGKRALSVNLGDDRETYPAFTLARNGSLFLNGLSPEYADRRDIAIIEHLKWELGERERQMERTIKGEWRKSWETRVKKERSEGAMFHRITG